MRFLKNFTTNSILLFYKKIKIEATYKILLRQRIEIYIVK